MFTSPHASSAKRTLHEWKAAYAVAHLGAPMVLGCSAQHPEEPAKIWLETYGWPVPVTSCCQSTAQR